MSDNIRSVIKERHAFYEVLPYCVVLDERHGSLPATTRRVQAGFDVDIYGVRTEDNKLLKPEPHEYSVSYAALQTIAKNVSQLTSDSCSLEAIPFPSTVVLDLRDNAKKVEAMLRIRISHFRGLDQPAGLPEQRALEDIEKQLKSLGVARR
jgi:hypothetical protein